MSEKGVFAVMGAVQNGATTSRAVAEALGTSQSYACAMLWHAVNFGLVRDTGRTEPGRKGVRRIYEVGDSGPRLFETFARTTKSGRTFLVRR